MPRYSKDRIATIAALIIASGCSDGHLNFDSPDAERGNSRYANSQMPDKVEVFEEAGTQLVSSALPIAGISGDTAPEAMLFPHLYNYRGKMLVYGPGSVSEEFQGGIYDPVASVWESIPPVGLQNDVDQFTTACSGTELLLVTRDAAKIYSFSKSEWLDLPLDNAPLFRDAQGKVSFSATSIDTGFVVWAVHTDAEKNIVSQAAIYEQAKGMWFPISMYDAPKPEKRPDLLATTRQLIVWGGKTKTGSGIYDLQKGKWQSIEPDSTHHGLSRAYLMENKLLIAYYAFDIFDPKTQQWADLGSSGDDQFTAASTKPVFDGKSLVVWGGHTNYDRITAEGRVFNVRSQRVTTLYAGDEGDRSPARRTMHGSLLIGTHLFLWGGCKNIVDDLCIEQVNDGAIIDLSDALE